MKQKKSGFIHQAVESDAEGDNGMDRTSFRRKDERRYDGSVGIMDEVDDLQYH